MTTNNHFQVPDRDRERLHTLMRLVDDLRRLDLLSENDLEAAQTYLDRADTAEATALSHGRHIDAQTRDIGAKLVGSNIDAAKIRAEAAKLADQTHVVRVCEALWTAAVREATTLVYSDAARYADVLNAQLTALAEKAAEVGDKLTEITSADAALLAGKGDEWIAAGELVATHQWLRSVIERLREAGKLPKPERGEGGPWWAFRTAPELIRGGFNVAAADTDGGRAKFFREMAAGPWVPTREEALEAAKVHDAAQVAYQTGGRG